MTDTAGEIAAIIREDLAEPAAPGVRAVAEAARAHHADAVEAVLFYGGCLRGGGDADSLVDLYLLVGSYRAVHRNPLARLANGLLPPNVYYLEVPFEDRLVRAKYAILSLAHDTMRSRSRSNHFQRLAAAPPMEYPKAFSRWPLPSRTLPPGT